MNQNNKVFCKECKFLFILITEDFDFIYSCTVQRDCVGEKSSADTWLNRGTTIKEYKKENPEILNKNNNCQYYSEGIPIKILQ